MSHAPVDVQSSTSCAALVAARHVDVEPGRHPEARWALLAAALVVWLGVLPAEILLYLDHTG